MLGVVIGAFALSTLLAQSPVAGAASAGRKADPKMWVHIFCTRFQPILQDIRDVSGSDALAASLGAEPAKDQTSSTLTQLDTSVATAIADLGRAGAPDIKNGSRVARSFRAALTALRDSLPAFQADLSALPSGDDVAFVASMHTLATRFQTSAQQNLAGLGSSQLKAPAIDAAIKHDQACLALSNR